jgi:hypothetical protein
LTLHKPQTISENYKLPDRVKEIVVVEEEVIFCELSTAGSNTATREIILPTPKKGTMGGKQTTEYETGPQ